MKMHIIAVKQTNTIRDKQKKKQWDREAYVLATKGRKVERREGTQTWKTTKDVI